ncbi:MAG: hypothetical protein JNL10_08770 [Verrucomicrobiales bacterium]|nr:hypothetical protein [Verrucomicrobiales bacterium]
MPGTSPSPTLTLAAGLRAAVLAFTMISAWGAEPSAETPPGPAAPVASTNCHNVFRVTAWMYSGSQPEGDAAFVELERLGIKTIVSVDGSPPDIETARRHGLRYVHLPFGYDGIPTNRWTELVRAAESMPGPLYVHCHHGKHRGPAAVALMCMAREGWTPGHAESWLHQAGTAAEYAGLYDALQRFKNPEAPALGRVETLPEMSPPTPLVATMVALDNRLDRLKSSGPPGGVAPGSATDRNAAHDAVLLWEQLRELGRHPDTSGRPAGYREKLAAAEEAARQLRDVLSGSPAPDAASREAALRRVVESCSACHKACRN